MATHSLAESVERQRTISQWTTFDLGSPPTVRGSEWRTVSDFHNPSAARELVEKLARKEYATSGAELRVVGNFVFRELMRAPLAFAGYMWAREYRVPHLNDNLALDVAAGLRAWHWMEARASGLPGDSATGIALVTDDHALDEALFVEVEKYGLPILSSFKRHRFVSAANGWGIILDCLLSGVLLAGRAEPELGLDGAWERWERAIAGRKFPLRRRPRRFSYESSPGCSEECAVRAGCCLWYTTPEAKQELRGQRYCITCPLESDETRLSQLLQTAR